MPELVPPTTAVRESYLEGERAACADEGVSAAYLDAAADDFDAFVARRAGVREGWGVPFTELWFVDGADYIGTAIVRHRLTTALSIDGGHIGFHVVPAFRRMGHGTALLREALAVAASLRLPSVILTCDAGNVGSRRVIEANGGLFEHEQGSVVRYRCHLSKASRRARPPAR